MTQVTSLMSRSLLGPLCAALLMVFAGAVGVADDGIELRILGGPGPGEVSLQWTGGVGPFGVYRSENAAQVALAANQIGLTNANDWLDAPPAAATAVFYVVISLGTGCPQDQTLCPAGCADLVTDGSNCGACGNVCAPGQSCAGGQCICPMGQVPSPAGCADVATSSVLSVGASGACAVLDDGRVACWGRNHYGELGLEAADDWTHFPSPVFGVSGAVSVGIRNTFACALTSGGNVQCWGSNGLGELGDETTMSRSAPAFVHGPAPGRILAGVTALSVGDNHSCVVEGSGGVYCWGANSSGQLGDGTAIRRPLATAISNPGGSQYVAVAVAAQHSCALASNGDVHCWGANSHGQLNGGQDGNGNPLYPGPGTWTPMRIASLSNVRAISAGDRHNCALLASGTGTCWGEVEHAATRPQPGLTDLRAVAAGGGYSCALDAGGQVLCWGSNLDFQLGSMAVSWEGTNPTIMTTAAPMAVANVVAIATGPRTICVATAGGEVQCWGGNFAGEAGNGLSRGSGDAQDMPNWLVDAATPYTLFLPGAGAAPGPAVRSIP